LFRVYDDAGNVIATREHGASSKDHKNCLDLAAFSLFLFSFNESACASNRLGRIDCSRRRLQNDQRKRIQKRKLSRVEPDGVVITFSGGVVKIPFEES